MGLLDDAIREHLELKRKRGADPAEVAQQEREALGPVRGAADPAAVAQEEDEPLLEDSEALPSDAEPELEAELDFDPEPAPRGAVRMPDPEPAYDPEPEPERAPPAAPEPVSQPTQQYSVDDLEDLRREADAEPEPVEDVVPADEDPPGEDELAETPDFLQEAPEHDRLWFEQRPPRDFDF